MKRFKEIYTKITDFLNETGFTLDDIQLYQEMDAINRAYELGLKENVLFRLFRLALDYYLKFEGNPSMYVVGKAMLDYYDKSYSVDDFIQNHFNKWKYFELISEEMGN